MGPNAVMPAHAETVADARATARDRRSFGAHRRRGGAAPRPLRGQRAQPARNLGEVALFAVAVLARLGAPLTASGRRRRADDALRDRRARRARPRLQLPVSAGGCLADAPEPV